MPRERARPSDLTTISAVSAASRACPQDLETIRTVSSRAAQAARSVNPDPLNGGFTVGKRKRAPVAGRTRDRSTNIQVTLRTIPIRIESGIIEYLDEPAGWSCYADQIRESRWLQRPSGQSLLDFICHHAPPDEDDTSIRCLLGYHDHYFVSGFSKELRKPIKINTHGIGTGTDDFLSEQLQGFRNNNITILIELDEDAREETLSKAKDRRRRREAESKASEILRCARMRRPARAGAQDDKVRVKQEPVKQEPVKQWQDVGPSRSKRKLDYAETPVHRITKRLRSNEVDEKDLSSLPTPAPTLSQDPGQSGNDGNGPAADTTISLSPLSEIGDSGSVMIATTGGDPDTQAADESTLAAMAMAGPMTRARLRKVS